MIMATSCATITTVDFDSPQGSKMTLRNKKYVFPVAVRLTQQTAPYLAENGYDIEIDIADSTCPSGFLTAKGKIYVYKTMLSDVDMLARNFFRIPQDKIESLRQGAAVTIEGMSADGGKRLYRAVLGMKKQETSLHGILEQ